MNAVLSFGHLTTRKTFEVLEPVQRRSVELVKDLGSESYEEQQKELGFFSLGETPGGPDHSLQHPEERW